MKASGPSQSPTLTGPAISKSPARPGRGAPLRPAPLLSPVWRYSSSRSQARVGTNNRGRNCLASPTTVSAPPSHSTTRKLTWPQLTSASLYQGQFRPPAHPCLSTDWDRSYSASDRRKLLFSQPTHLSLKYLTTGHNHRQWTRQQTLTTDSYILHIDNGQYNRHVRTFILDMYSRSSRSLLAE